MQKLRLPQIRVLTALSEADGGAVSRNDLCERAGFSAGSGTLNYALNGMKVSKGNPRGHPGLIELGLIERHELDIDGVMEVIYTITQQGQEALVRDGRSSLPQLRDRDISTNNRYKGR